MADKSLVEEQLKCPICHGILEDARLLECGHSYCKTCIGAVIESKAINQLGRRLLRMECPVCRQNVSIPGGSSSALKQNWIVNNIVQVLADSEKQEEEIPDTCEVHPGNEENYYCKECNVIVCCQCAISDHIHYRRGIMKPQMIEDAIGDIKSKIKTLLENAEDWLAQHVVYEDAIADIKQVGSQAMDLVKRDILQEYDARLELLNQSRVRLLDHVSEKKDSFCKSMDELLQTEREYVDNMKQSRMQINGELDTGTDRDVVKLYQDWSREMKGHLSYGVPNTADVENDLKMARALYFEKSPIPFDSLYRDIGFIGNHMKSDVVQTSSASDVEGEDNQCMSERTDNSYNDQDMQGYLYTEHTEYTDRDMQEYKYNEYTDVDFQVTCNRRRKINKKKK